MNKRYKYALYIHLPPYFPVSRHNYSQTCESRLPKGKTEHGLYRQVVFIWRLLCFHDLRLLCGHYLQDGLNFEVVFNSSLTVHVMIVTGQ